MSMTVQDQELLAGLRRGESQAQEQLLLRYGEPIIQFLVAVCRVDLDDAEDLAVETLYRAIEYIDSFTERPETGPNTFRNWLFTIARNRWRTSLRRQPPISEVDDIETLIAPSADSVSSEIKAVQEALDQLPEGQRLTLQLHYGGTSLADVAIILGQPAGTVRQWKRRGLATLTHILRNNPALAYRFSEMTIAGETL
jgi:RNA polymerase sigma factor (sigma-70 family)